MKNRAIPFIIIILLGLCLLLWFRTKPQQKSIAVENARTTLALRTNTAPNVSKNDKREQPPNSPSSTLPPVQQSSGTAAKAQLPVDQRLLSEWRAPIDFYGKVVDESGNPVSGANVQFTWNEKPIEGDDQHSSMQSDSNGLFELHGAHGPSLDVRVSKPGYYTLHNDRWSFAYSMSDSNYVASAADPAIFHLRKKGRPEALIHVKQNYRIPKDGTPIAVNLLSGKMTPGETGDFVVRCWTDQAIKPGQKYNWRCVITAPGGGLVGTSEEFPFLAPEQNYIPSIQISMPSDRPDWKDNVNLQFYFHLADGKYGRMTFSMVAGGHHFFMIDSFLNQTGSRNLEPLD